MSHAPYPEEQRLATWLANTDRVGDCLIWRGAKIGTGYGVVRLRGRLHTASRAVYMLSFGIEDDLHVDHLCRNRACINPDHLEAVTPQENWRRKYEGAPLAGR